MPVAAISCSTPPPSGKGAKQRLSGMSIRPAVDAPARQQRGLDHALAVSMQRLAQIGSALNSDVKLARRDNPLHAQSIAVLAYTNKWDGFINQHLRGKRDYLQPFENGLATQYAGTIAFFAPLQDLQKILGVNRVPSAAAVGLELGVARSGEPKAACALKLRISGGSREDDDEAVRLITDLITVPAGKGDTEALRIWEATITNIYHHLERSAEVTSAGHWTSNTQAFRGMRMAADTDQAEVLASMSKVLVSASYDKDVADRFATSDASDTSGRIKWLIQLEVDAGVRVINVNANADRVWQCWNEREVIILPGAFYTAVWNQNRPGPTNTMTVRVTALAPTNNSRKRAAPDFQAPSLYAAAVSGDLDEVKRLLAEGARPNDGYQRNSEGTTALMQASAAGRLGIVNELLAARANPNSLNNANETALILASSSGRVDAVIALLAAGAWSLIDHVSARNDTALIAASRGGHVQVVNALLQGRADVNGVDSMGMTPLMVASYYGHVEVVTALINANAKLKAVDAGKKLTPAGWATKGNHPELAKMLRAWKVHSVY